MLTRKAFGDDRCWPRRRMLIHGLALALAISASFQAGASPFAYVTNSDTNTVSVLDMAPFDDVSATVAVGRSPRGLAATPDGKRVYVANSGSGTVSVINTATNTLSGEVAVGSKPQGIAVAPDGKRVYVANYDSKNISVIDTDSNAVSATFPTASRSPAAVAIAPDGKHVYVAEYGVGVYETGSNRVLTLIQFGSSVTGLAITPDGKRLYALAPGANVVGVIDTATNTKAATIPCPPTTWEWNKLTGVAVAPDGKHVYVTSAVDFFVIATADNTLSVNHLIAAGRSPGLAVTPDGKYILVGWHGDINPGGVNRFDAASYFHAGGAYLYLSHSPEFIAIATPTFAEHFVSGTINGDGSVKSAGTKGFTVQKQSAGQYLITFTPPFADTPAIVGSQTNFGNVSDENPSDNVVFPLLDKGSATVVTGDSEGNHKDRTFSFIARGIQ